MLFGIVWYIPVLIYLARICDVSIGTNRSMQVIAGHRYIAAFLGFFEVIIWVMAVGGALKYVTHPLALIAYAGGFATGVIIGMKLESWLALGYRMVRIISHKPNTNISEALREQGYRVTRVDGSGRSGSVELAFLVIKRSLLPQVTAQICKIDPEVFITVERVDQASGGGFTDSRYGIRAFQWMLPVRK